MINLYGIIICIFPDRRLYKNIVQRRELSYGSIVDLTKLVVLLNYRKAPCQSSREWDKRLLIMLDIGRIITAVNS